MQTQPVVNIDRVWNTVLMPKLHDIFCGDAKVSYQAYIDTYGSVYTILQPDAYAKTANNNGQELYCRLFDFFDTYALKVYAAAPANDAELHRIYQAAWARFHPGLVLFKGLFTLLNKGWVRCQRAAGNMAILELGEMALAAWGANVLEPISPRLRMADVTCSFAGTSLDTDTVSTEFVWI
ncbi:hypothetical protein MVEN_00291800 [Mycena venus]|uniref:Cullin N-terminal domain-containing protein n=1 Tax=Mycena venus TaxID=2733690 RepID=A0A8H7DCR3_9AGAR|nr:hypothetical protein MVEN_00291800 [Mycena venus]